MRRQIIATTAVAIVASSLFFTSCNKDDKDTAKSTMRMHLTDGPASYQAVNLDIQSVEVTVEGHSAVTVVPGRPGIYNILKFRNGMDTLLLTSDIPSGKISQIRLVLGSNNTIMVDGITYPLSTPSGQQSGVKLNVHETFLEGEDYDVWLDIDAGKSIVTTGSGDYKLKPVISAYTAISNGRISGYVLPGAALATVYAINGTDTFSAIPDVHTYYKISGLAAGTYKVWVRAGVGLYTDIMYDNVVVVSGTEIDMGTTVLNP